MTKTPLSSILTELNELKKNLRIVERAMKSKGDDTNDKADEKY